MTFPLAVFSLLLLSLCAQLLLRSPDQRAGRRFWPRPSMTALPPTPIHRLHPPKPQWVRTAILRLKALMPAAGCRRIAHTFNRIHEAQRNVTVGKTFVARELRHHGEEVLRLRRHFKHRRPRPLARNVIWALDWTWIPDANGESRPVLGVLDHGSRACLELRPVETRRTVALLRQLLDVIERFGTPKVLRTDNEPAACSLLFRVVLRVLGIRHQRTEPFAIWLRKGQNGRIERLFRTLKKVLLQRDAGTGSHAVSASDLARIRTWYNHLRPHQHLGGWTPAEV